MCNTYIVLHIFSAYYSSVDYNYESNDNPSVGLSLNDQQLFDVIIDIEYSSLIHTGRLVGVCVCV